MTEISREEHLAWAKERALNYARQGDVKNTLASMGSDLRQHSELRDHAGLLIGMMEAVAGTLETPRSLIAWVEGFH